jgi:hypothetical protein
LLHVAAEIERLQANVQHAGNPCGHWVLFTPANTSEPGLKTSAGIRNPMLYPTELQAQAFILLALMTIPLAVFLCCNVLLQ